MVVNQHRNKVLLDYIKDTSVLLKKNNGSLTKNLLIHAIARAKTLAIFQQLDGFRQQQILTFLIDTRQLTVTNESAALDISQAKLSDIHISASPRIECIKKGDLSLKGVFLQNSTFRTTRVCRIDFSQSVFNNVSFILFKEFRPSTDHSLLKIYDINFSTSSLSKVNVSFVDIYKINFSYSYLSEVNFSSSVLYDINFHSTSPVRVNFLKTNVKKVNFTFINSDTVNFSFAFLIDVEFHGAVMKDATFSFASLDRVDFTDSILTKVDFEYTTLTKVDFAYTILTKVNFSRAVLKDTTFSSANFTSGMDNSMEFIPLFGKVFFFDFYHFI